MQALPHVPGDLRQQGQLVGVLHAWGADTLEPAAVAFAGAGRDDQRVLVGQAVDTVGGQGCDVQAEAELAVVLLQGRPAPRGVAPRLERRCRQVHQGEGPVRTDDAGPARSGVAVVLQQPLVVGELQQVVGSLPGPGTLDLGHGGGVQPAGHVGVGAGSQRPEGATLRLRRHEVGLHLHRHVGGPALGGGVGQGDQQVGPARPAALVIP